MVGAVTAAFVGAAFGLGVRMLHTVYKDRRERNRLRRGLYEEMKTMSDDIDDAAHELDSVANDADDVPVPTDTFVTTTYESTADQIGLLSDPEVDDVVEFYSMCFRVRRLLAEIDENDVSTGDAITLHEAMVDVQNQLLDAMTTLETELALDPGHTTSLSRITSDPGRLSELDLADGADSDGPHGTDGTESATD